MEVKGLSCGYEKQKVLQGVNLQIMQGDFVGLLGPSGSGKTTLLRSILGAVDVYEGEVLVDGARATERRPRIGYIRSWRPSTGTSR